MSIKTVYPLSKYPPASITSTSAFWEDGNHPSLFRCINGIQTCIPHLIRQVYKHLAPNRARSYGFHVLKLRRLLNFHTDSSFEMPRCVHRLKSSLDDLLNRLSFHGSTKRRHRESLSRDIDEGKISIWKPGFLDQQWTNRGLQLRPISTRRARYSCTSCHLRHSLRVHSLASANLHTKNK